jgi:hypothetical protein
MDEQKQDATEKPQAEAPAQPEWSIKIENGELVVRAVLTQKNGKMIAKGVLIDAINVVDEFFFMLKQRRLAAEAEALRSNKRVIDSIIRPNGGN